MPYARRFLYALGRALDARLLHPPGHPMRLAADQEMLDRLDALTVQDPAPRFRFRLRQVAYGFLPLHELADWEWAGRLAAAGVNRIEATAPVAPASLRQFLDQVGDAIQLEEMVPDTVTDGLSWGGENLSRVESALATDLVGNALEEEFSLARSLFARAARGEPISLADVTALLAGLHMAIWSDGSMTLPLLNSVGRDDYLASHAINSAVLALALAEQLGLGSAERRECGRAALLHDIGMVRVPEAALTAESPSGADRARIRVHPVEGARYLLRQGDGWELPAVAAYEHHLQPNGEGYPRLNYPRDVHYVSRMVAVCGSYDALRTDRPDRPAWDPDDALRQIELGQGSQFDPRMSEPFCQMVREVEDRGQLVLISRPD